MYSDQSTTFRADLCYESGYKMFAEDGGNGQLFFSWSAKDKTHQTFYIPSGAKPEDLVKNALDAGYFCRERTVRDVRANCTDLTDVARERFEAEKPERDIKPKSKLSWSQACWQNGITL